MKALVLATALVGILASSMAMANADLAKTKNCMGCHAVDNKVLGPSFKDVVAKYSGQKDAQAELVQSVMKGSSGKWGAIAMPANNVTEAEAKSLVTWILSLK